MQSAAWACKRGAEGGVALACARARTNTRDIYGCCVVYMNLQNRNVLLCHVATPQSARPRPKQEKRFTHSKAQTFSISCARVLAGVHVCWRPCLRAPMCLYRPDHQISVGASTLTDIWGSVHKVSPSFVPPSLPPSPPPSLFSRPPSLPPPSSPHPSPSSCSSVLCACTGR